MTRIFLSHRVADYAHWRAIFDADAPRRTAAGVIDVAVLRSSADPNHLLVEQHHAADEVSVRAMLDGMFADPAVGEAMKAAGVIGPAQVWIG